MPQRNIKYSLESAASDCCSGLILTTENLLTYLFERELNPYFRFSIMADPPAPTGDYIMASRNAASLIISSGYDKEGQFKDKQVPFDEVSQSQEEKSIRALKLI